MADTSKRKGRPLLAAAVGVAFVSFATQQACEPRPVGNLRVVDTSTPPGGNTAGTAALPSPDATGGGGTAPVENPQAGGSAAPPASGGSVADLPTLEPPVGNLRTPETEYEPEKPPPASTGKPKGNPPHPKPHPVGNLRPPD